MWRFGSTNGWNLKRTWTWKGTSYSKPPWIWVPCFLNFGGVNNFIIMCSLEHTAPICKNNCLTSHTPFQRFIFKQERLPGSNMWTALKTRIDALKHLRIERKFLSKASIFLGSRFYVQDSRVYIYQISLYSLWIPVRVLEKSFWSPWLIFWRCQICLWTHRIPWGINKPTHLFYWYCWWFRHLPNHLGCIKPSKNDELSISTGAEFLPPTVATQKIPKKKNTPTLSPKWISVFLPNQK